MRRYTASLAFLLTACAVPVAPPALRPIVAIEGPNSRVTQLQIVRIRTQQQMATWWLTHLGRERSPQSLELGYYDSTAGVPEVDFDAYEVVAVFVGSRRNSAGVAAIEVVDESGCRRFRYDGMPFQSEGPSGGAVRNMPYGFFVLPRTTLPIVVEEDVHNRIGAPREWQERARLP